MKKRLIPFWMMPASWGLKGKHREEAEAAYYLEGEALERRLAQIEFNNDPKGLQHRVNDINLKWGYIDEYTHARQALTIDGLNTDPYEALSLERKFGKISDYDHDRERAKLDFTDETELALAFLEIDLAYEKIDQKTYEKERATLKQEPWVGIVDDGFDLTQGPNGVYFKFDWNEYWIEFLRLNGYVGLTDEEVVEQWFNDTLRSMAMEGLFNDEDHPLLSGRYPGL